MTNVPVDIIDDEKAALLEFRDRLFNTSPSENGINQDEIDRLRGGLDEAVDIFIFTTLLALVGVGFQVVDVVDALTRDFLADRIKPAGIVFHAL